MDGKCEDCGRFVSYQENWTTRTNAVYDNSEEQFFPEEVVICEKCSEVKQNA